MSDEETKVEGEMPVTPEMETPATTVEATPVAETETPVAAPAPEEHTA